jgi:hypothetical protein
MQALLHWQGKNARGSWPYGLPASFLFHPTYAGRYKVCPGQARPREKSMPLLRSADMCSNESRLNVR